VVEDLPIVFAIPHVCVISKIILDSSCNVDFSSY